MVLIPTHGRRSAGFPPFSNTFLPAILQHFRYHTTLPAISPHRVPSIRHPSVQHREALLSLERLYRRTTDVMSFVRPSRPLRGDREASHQSQWRWRPASSSGIPKSEYLLAHYYLPTATVYSLENCSSFPLSPPPCVH